jgi:hypothetical protein
VFLLLILLLLGLPLLVEHFLFVELFKLPHFGSYLGESKMLKAVVRINKGPINASYYLLISFDQILDD